MKKEIIQNRLITIGLVLTAFVVGFLFCFLTSASAIVVTSTPPEFSFETNISQNFSIKFTLISYDVNVTYEDVYFNATHVDEFIPYLFDMEYAYPTDVTAVVRAPEIPDTYGDAIVVSGMANGTRHTLLTVPLTITVLPPRLYHFKKCFFENKTEYCADLELPEIQNITIINYTINRTERHFLLDTNLTMDLFAKFIIRMENISEDVHEATEEIKESQQIQQDAFRNAMMLEEFLKNSGNPTWVQIMPLNIIRNTTGMADADIHQALTILYQGGKVVQKTVKEKVTYPLPGGGIVTEEKDIVYIASTERIGQEQQSELFKWVIVAVIIIVILCIVFVALSGRYKERIKRL